MSNVTNPFSKIPIQYYVFMVEGIGLVLFNGVVALAIFRYSYLRGRKEYLIIAGLALADAIAGLGYIIAPIDRIPYILAGKQNTLTNAWSCMQRPHNWCFILGGHIGAPMLVCVSLDRLIASVDPTYYFTLTSKYAWRMLTAFYTYGTLSFIVCIISAYTHTREGTASILCLAYSSIGHKVVADYHYQLKVGASSLSVIIYIFVPLFYWRSLKVLTTETQAEKMKKQRSLIITLGISFLFTFLFFVVPNFVRGYLAPSFSPELRQILLPWGSCFQNINPLLNMFLYLAKLSQVKKGVVAAVTCKSGIEVAAMLTAQNH